MNALAYPPTNEEIIFQRCTKECGVVTATDDFQFFTLACIFCSEKFLYFDAFIGHLQTVHLDDPQKILSDDGVVANAAEVDDDDEFDDGNGNGNHAGNEHDASEAADKYNNDSNGNELLTGILFTRDGRVNDEEPEDLTDADPTALLEPQMIIKQEIKDEDNLCDENDAPTLETGTTDMRNDADLTMDFLSSMYADDASVMEETENNEYDNEYVNTQPDPDDASGGGVGAQDEKNTTYPNYDEMVEESLLGQESELTMHIKDRKMIQFLIDSYRRNPFLWDHRHPQFRDRVKRQRFLDWIVHEFKRRFNIMLAKDAITRKWDNLRTVYKRECNRMALERTNISTLWYFKELHFLNSLYRHTFMFPTEAVITDTTYRRRLSAIWNDVSTAKLLSMVKRYQCFYNRNDPDYRNKEKRGKALQQMAAELQGQIDVTTIQISKRISQLRFDYSKQKLERLVCERQFKQFLPTFIYYEQMHFMDDDVAPYKCTHCDEIFQLMRDLELHMLSHQSQQIEPGVSTNKFQVPTIHKEMKYQCDLCTASFREKSNYDEHMRRHNDDLLLPSLKMENDDILNETEMDMKYAPETAAATTTAAVGETNTSLPNNILHVNIGSTKPYSCEICMRTFATQGHLNAHRVVHTDDRERRFKCDYPQCGKIFLIRQTLLEHVKMHYSEDEYRCEICGKGFKSSKNLQNHKQIHDKVKRYICHICGSAFAQAAGLYLHKRRHNRHNPMGQGPL